MAIPSRNLVKPQDPQGKTPSLSAAVKIKPVEAAKDLQQPRRLFWHSDLNATCLEWLSFGDAQKKKPGALGSSLCPPEIEPFWWQDVWAKQWAAANKALPLALNASGCDSQRELAWKRLNADSAVDDWTMNLYRIQLGKKFLSPENAQDQEWSLMDYIYIYIYVY